MWQVIQSRESPPLRELTAYLTKHLLKEDTVSYTAVSPEEKGLNTFRKINDRPIGKESQQRTCMIFKLKPQGQ